MRFQRPRPPESTFDPAQTLLGFLVNLLQLVQTAVELRPQLVDLLQHQAAPAGALLHHARWGDKHMHAGGSGTRRARDALSTHSPLPGRASGVVCPGLSQENLADAGHSKHSNTTAGGANTTKPERSGRLLHGCCAGGSVACLTSHADTLEGRRRDVRSCSVGGLESSQRSSLVYWPFVSVIAPPRAPFSLCRAPFLPFFKMNMSSAAAATPSGPQRFHLTCQRKPRGGGGRLRT